jgi:hypothetical protein
MAVRTHDSFSSAPETADRAADLERGRSLNTATDVLLIGGVVATAVAAVLYFTTEEMKGRPSGASVARGER